MKTVFFDVDTQIDFLFPAGALYVPGSESIIPLLGDLNRWAAANGIVVVSTMDAHSENDPEFKLWPPHCVVGTASQEKPRETLLEARVVVPNHSVELKLDGVRQVILEKQTTDCFTNANMRRLLDALGADRYVVYGVATEVCVKNALVGLLQTGKRVELVTDAIKSLSEEGSAKTLDEFQARGGILITAAMAATGNARGAVQGLST